MTEARFRQLIILILILAAVLRIGWLAAGDVLPVMWDARRYVAAAIGILSTLDKPGPVVPEPRDGADRDAFDHY